MARCRHPLGYAAGQTRCPVCGAEPGERCLIDDASQKPRPEGCGPGGRIDRTPTLDDYDRMA